MSDDFSGSYASIDSALDNALDAVGQVQNDHVEAVEEGVLPPTALSTEGLFEQAKKLAADRKNAKAEKAKADKAEKGEEKFTKAEIHARKVKERDEGLDAALDKATTKSGDAQKKREEERAGQNAGEKPRPMATRDFNSKEVIEHRRELRSRFPGVKLSERMAQFEKWETSLRKDPVGTREAIMNAYLKFSPSNFTKGKTVKEAEGLNGALDRATEGANDLADLKPFADKYGERLPHLLRQLNDLEKDLIADPVGASARLAANYGAVDAPAQKQQQAPEPPHVEYERVTQGVTKIVEDRVFPGLERDDIAEAVAMVLDHMPRTADRFADLRTAYGIVVGQPPAAAPQPVNTNGMKSIHGAPSSPGHSRRSTGRDGLDQSLNKAFGRI